MKQLLILTFALLFAFSTFSQEKPKEIIEHSTKTTTYYFIRHAEKNRSDTNNKNPNLIENGILRAAKWSLVLEHIKFNAVYSTNYNRTKQTAQPIAEKNGLDITLYEPDNLNSEEFIKNTKGKTVFVVGHSDTTPNFVNTILGKAKYSSINDNNNANLYIVTIFANGDVFDTLLVID